MAKKLCPLKFSFTDGSTIAKGTGQVDCENDRCEWWDNKQKSCHIAIIGSFMKSLHMDLDSVQLQLQKMQGQ